MTRKKKAPIAPIDCRTTDELCSIHRDNLSTKHGWALTDGYNVTIARQEAGKPAEGSVTLPRAEMKRLLTFLLTPQKRTAEGESDGRS